MSFPALFSGAALFVTAGLALLIARATERLTWAVLGAFFVFMGTDELIQIHENLGDSSGIDWQILYFPVLAAAGACWLGALRRMWEFESERLLWLGGAVAWIVAQMLEFAVEHHWTLLIGEIAWAEEILEMSGSSMFLLALYLVSRRVAAGRSLLGRHHPGTQDAV